MPVERQVLVLKGRVMSPELTLAQHNFHFNRDSLVCIIKLAVSTHSQAQARHPHTAWLTHSWTTVPTSARRRRRKARPPNQRPRATVTLPQRKVSKVCQSA